MTEIHAETLIRAPREAVWAFLTHHEGLPGWSPLKRVDLDPPGSPNRDGLGAVRHMRGAGPTIVEEVVAWDPPNSYAYTLRRGAPIRDHRGQVALEDDGDGIRVTWDISFRPLVPGTGWLLRAVLGRAISGMLSEAKKQLEQAQ